MDSWLRSISFTYKLLRNNLLNVEENEFLQRLIQRIDPGKMIPEQSPAKENVPELPEKPTALVVEEGPSGPPHVAMPLDFREKRGCVGMALAKYHMGLVVDLMKEKGIPVTIAVYPWPDQIRENDRNSIQELEWQQFCLDRGIGFISYFDDFVRDNSKEIIDEYFIPGDVHWNEQGHALVSRKLLKYYNSKLYKE